MTEGNIGESQQSSGIVNTFWAKNQSGHIFDLLPEKNTKPGDKEVVYEKLEMRLTNDSSHYLGLPSKIGESIMRYLVFKR